jgi:cation transport regulator ChaC
MTENVLYYFAYGSNMNPARVEKRAMKFDAAQSGLLRDYELRFNKRSVKYPGAAAANVMPSTSEVTEGVLYRLTHADQISMMDPFEGYPVRYDRVALPIETASTTVDAWVYIANRDHVAEGLAPARWYLQHLLAGEDFLSVAYFSVLRQVKCLPSSDVEPG